MGEWLTRSQGQKNKTEEIKRITLQTTRFFHQNLIKLCFFTATVYTQDESKLKHFCGSIMVFNGRRVWEVFVHMHEK